MGEFKGRLVQPPSTSKREIEPKNRMLEKLLAYLSVSTAASLALAACGIAEGSTNSQPQATEPVPLSSPTPDALNQLSNIELFNQFVTNQVETGHQFPTPTVFSSSEGTGLKPEQNQSIEQLLNTFVNLAQNQKVLNFSNDGLGVNTNSLGQIMIEDTLVFDFGNKGKAGMFLVSSEKGNKAYYLSNNGETATQLVFSIRYKDGSVEAFFDPKQVEAVLKETDPSLIESTNWNGIFMRPEVLGDNPADNFFATTREMQYEGEGTAFLFDVLSLDQQNLAMFDPGTLDMGFFKVETAAETEPTEEPTPAPIFGSKVLMSILVPTPTVEEVVPTAEPTPTPEPTQTPEQALEEFKESAEYKQGLQDYLDAMNLSEEQVVLTVENKIINNNELIFLVANKTTVLFNLKEGNWQRIMPGEYWRYYGKFIGAHINGDDWKYNKAKALNIFSNGGSITLTGQVRPGPDIQERKPQNASGLFEAVKENNMALVFAYVAEPGKFPSTVNSNNVDDWLKTRFEETANLIVSNKTSQPVLVQFNEPFEGPKWNREANPLKDKYQENWLGEYLYSNLLVFINNDLQPNVDFMPFINENKMIDPVMSEYVHAKISEARLYAYNKLIQDHTIKNKLETMGIFNEMEIKILTGSETYINLDGQSRQKIVFTKNPTIEELNAFANKFADLGGVVFTEVAPFGEAQLQLQFLEKLAKVVLNNQNAFGLTIWNAFNNPEDQTDVYMSSPSLLIDDNGRPTFLFYAFMNLP